MKRVRCEKTTLKISHIRYPPRTVEIKAKEKVEGKIIKLDGLPYNNRLRLHTMYLYVYVAGQNEIQVKMILT